MRPAGKARRLRILGVLEGLSVYNASARLRTPSSNGVQFVASLFSVAVERIRGRRGSRHDELYVDMGICQDRRVVRVHRVHRVHGVHGALVYRRARGDDEGRSS
jgi:hypothetical protein